MRRTVKLDLKEDDYFGSITFIDGTLDQFIIQIYNHKERIHSDEQILQALSAQISQEQGNDLQPSDSEAKSRKAKAQ